jgi:hypothetical protein
VPRPYRILVTGSRDWDDVGLLTRELKAAIGEAASLGRPAVIVHGDCETGADAMADRLARSAGLTPEAHPADWEGPCRASCKPGHRRRCRDGTDYCPAAGPFRNAEMVAAGADAALAFIKNGSPGATGCAALAERARIRVRRYLDPWKASDSGKAGKRYLWL